MARIHDHAWSCGCYTQEVCMWISYAVVWGVGTLGVFWFYNLDIFRPILFSSPAWVTLMVGPNIKELSVRRVVVHTLVMFLSYWSVMQAYPVQCRNAWGAAMVGDSTYWRNNTAISQALIRQKDEYFPLLSVNGTSWRERLTTPHKPLFVMHKDSAWQPGADVVRSRHDVSVESAELILEIVQKQHPESHLGEKWVMPWTRGDTLENFELRAYCDLHRDDPALPHVFPLRTFGINTRQIGLSASCPFWTCVLTEARPGGKLAFLWMLAVPALLHATHYRLNCNLCTYFLGSGQCRLWWVWFWATLLPFWLVMLIKSTRDTELIPFFVEEVTVLFELRKWFIGKDTANDNEHLAIFVLVIGAGVLVYIFRDKVRRELGLDELVPLIFSGGATHGRHTFQLCIWRVDLNSKAGPQMYGEESTIMDSVPSTSSRSDDARSLSFFPSGVFRGFSYLPLPIFSRSREVFGLRGRDGQTPKMISVRFLYGTEEVQRTRVQQISYSYDGASYDFYENFILSIEPRPNVEFRVEVRDETGEGTTLGSLNFSELRLKRQFARSKDVVKQMDMSIADEQLMQMRQVRAMTRATDELMMRRMGEAGFVVHRLPEGGAVWLAFSDLSEEGFGLFSCCA